ncbi:MAG: ABC transporter permease subunit [Micromonosporaceae bacterium]|nr:ABC transporter permease subunit [Micromonosporaceae bacterium]
MSSALDAPEAAERAETKESRRPPHRRRRLSPGALLAYVVLVPGAILFVAPFAWLVSASFQHMGDIFSWPPQWIPNDPTLDGYRTFFGFGPTGKDQANVWRWLANSVFVATSVTVLQLLFNSMAAYVFAKRHFPGRDIIFFGFLATMMVPPHVTLIPNYLVLRYFPLFGGNDILGQGGHGMLDSYYGLILPGTVSAFGIFLLRQYMMSIPDELLDAARVDGASELRIFWKVVLPLSVPALAATAIFTFMFVWEDFLWPLIVISSPEYYTMPLGLALFVVRNRTAWDVLMAGSVVATIPMIVVFMIFQRKFVQGISLSGLKG